MRGIPYISLCLARGCSLTLIQLAFFEVVMSLYMLFVCVFSFSTVHALVEDLDASGSIFDPNADNVEGPYLATILDSPSLGETNSADASIFDDTSLGISTFDNGENLFSASPGLDDSTHLAFAHWTSALDSLPAASDMLYSTQDIDSKVFPPEIDQWTD